MDPHAAYDELLQRSREQTLLSSCAELLGWDELTYMPRGGVANRGNQLAFLSGLQHEMTAHPRVGELLACLESSDLVRDPDSDGAVNVREMRRAYHRATRVPRRLVEEQVRTTSFAQQIWADALHQSDFALFRPWLEKVIVLARREAECLGPPEAAYDSLLDYYEPGVRSRDLIPLFDALRAELVPLVAAIAGSRRRADVSLLHREYPIDRQRTFGEAVVSAIGFDFSQGRLDETPHPFFGTIGPGDCRITTRYQLHNFSDAFFGTLHEAGHALYEQGLDPAHQGTPLGQAPSLGIHESQSRLWENLVGRSRPFWQHFLPLARQVFHEALRGVRSDAFYFAVNHSAPSPLRVQSDEVTYNLHIMVRFELERALLNGDLKAADVPAAWEESYFRTLGIRPANDAEGCLQDGHWSAGMIGYFPTYTLGNIFAAQMFARAAEELGDLDAQLARGEFAGLLGWLREKVHRQGSRYPAARLVERATGAPPDHRPLMRLLWQKFGELYGL